MQLDAAGVAKHGVLAAAAGLAAAARLAAAVALHLAPSLELLSFFPPLCEACYPAGLAAVRLDLPPSTRLDLL